MTAGFRYGVRGYIGMPGSGKSYCLAVDAYKEFRKGRRVLSNYLGFGEPLGDVAVLGDAFNCVVALDEAGLVLSSRQWGKVPPQLLERLAQVRHYHVELWYTVQNVSRIDKVLRELTFEWYQMHSLVRLGLFVVRVLDHDMEGLGWELRRFSPVLASQLYGTFANVELPPWLAAARGQAPSREVMLGQALQRCPRLLPWVATVASMSSVELGKRGYC